MTDTATPLTATLADRVPARAPPTVGEPLQPSYTYPRRCHRGPARRTHRNGRRHPPRGGQPGPSASRLRRRLDPVRRSGPDGPQGPGPRRPRSRTGRVGRRRAGRARHPAPPRTSTDMFRYAWDGRVQAAGISPYAHPPAAPEPAPLRDDWLFPSEGACED